MHLKEDEKRKNSNCRVKAQAGIRTACEGMRMKAIEIGPAAFFLRPSFIKKILFLSVALFLSIYNTKAQQKNNPQKDSAASTITGDNQTLQEIRHDRIDSSQKFYEKLKKKFLSRRITRQLYPLLFREPYRKPVAMTPEKPKDPYRAYNNRFIGNIQVKKLDPFGPRVNDTLRQAANWPERFANSLHVTTREFVIKRSLLFEKGDRLNSSQISDNERILRLTPYLTDARIYVLPRRNDRDTVDILVVTQDVLSTSGGISGDFRSGRIDLYENNFFGFGHEFRTRTSYSSKLDPLKNRSQGWGFRGLYRIPFIGKTFITGEAEYINEWNNDRKALLLRRDFLTPSTKYAGGLEMSRNRLLAQAYPLIKDSSSVLYSYSYNLADLWLGRSFRFRFGNERFRERARLIVAGRTTGYNYFERPIVREDTNRLYQNRFLNLLSIGFSSRSYFRDVQIYGFGRTEDVPYGGLFSLTGGLERTEFGFRYYTAAKASLGRYYSGFGYLVASANVGSFVRSGHWEQGVLRADFNYFSRLIELGAIQIRQFIDLRYTRGVGRFDQEFIDIGSRNGIRGVGSAALRGAKSLVLNLETVAFTPLNILGFQIATFAYTDLGFITQSKVKLLRGQLFSGFGLGIRVRNENLAFNTFQFRLGIYPNIPYVSSPIRTDFSGIPRTRLTDFTITAPEVIPFR